MLPLTASHYPTLCSPSICSSPVDLKVDTTSIGPPTQTVTAICHCPCFALLDHRDRHPNNFSHASLIYPRFSLQVRHFLPIIFKKKLCLRSKKLDIFPFLSVKSLFYSLACCLGAKHTCVHISSFAGSAISTRAQAPRLFNVVIFS